jgi:hypothetical protein
MPHSDELLDKLIDVDRHYQLYTDKLSTACRQLAFCEGAIFWMFQQKYGLSNLIIFGLFFLALFFVFDTLQYRYGMLDYEKHGDELRKILNTNEPGKQNLCKATLNPNLRLERSFSYKFNLLICSSLILSSLFICIFLGLAGYDRTLTHL